MSLTSVTAPAGAFTPALTSVNLQANGNTVTTVRDNGMGVIAVTTKTPPTPPMAEAGRIDVSA